MPDPLNVVIAPDSLKGTVHAAEAAEAIAAGWREVRPDDRLELRPQADGGEGTLAAIAAAVPGAERRDAGLVTGPDGSPLPASWLLLPGGEAVVELAVSSGLPLMPLLDPLGATTRGVGEVIAAALDAGAESIVLALGGTASTDGGTGALAALGARFLDAHGGDLPDGGGALVDLAHIVLDDLRPPPTRGVRLLTDVTSPLLGVEGAAAVFGPQKGAGPDDVRLLDAALARLAMVAGGDSDAAGAGAAGGTAFGFATLWGAHIEPGAPSIAALTRLDGALETADVLVTGEGRFDDQSLRGKVVGHALELAGAAGIRTAVIAGRLDLAPPDWGGDLTQLAGSVEAAMAEPLRWLEEAGRRAASELGVEAASAPPHPAPLD